MTSLVFLGGFLLLIVVGCPIAYAMLVSSAAYIFMVGLPELQLSLRLSAGVHSFSLLAIPMFLLAGNLMNGLGVTERIFTFASVLVRHVSGGLGHVNVLASVIFAGMSGSAVADAGGLGAVEIKAMKEAGYSERFSAAVTAASATIGPIIPPSITMVVYGFLTDESVGRLFLAGLIPGLLVAAGLMAVIYVRARTGLEKTPRLPRASAAEVRTAFVRALPALLAPVILLAGIFTGVFTPTEASVVVVLYVLAIGSMYLGFNWPQILAALKETARTSAATLFIIAVSAVFGWIITIQRLPMELVGTLSGNVDSQIGIMLFIVGVLLIIGMFMEVLAALVLLVPTFMALAHTFAIDPVHLGVTVVVTMMIGTITPPIGLVLYTVTAVSDVTMGRLVRALIPFYAILLVVALAVALVPEFSLFLPNLLMGPG